MPRVYRNGSGLLPLQLLPIVVLLVLVVVIPIPLLLTPHPASALDTGSLIHRRRRRRAERRDHRHVVNTNTAAVNADDEATRPNTIKCFHPKQKPRVYKHLFRHHDDISFDSWLRCSDPESFFQSIGYSEPEIQLLLKENKDSSKWNVHDHLAPKIRFIVETMGGGTGRLAWTTSTDNNRLSTNPVNENEECEIIEDDEEHHSLRLHDATKSILPPFFFDPSLSLDRTIGPYHAYLAADSKGQRLLQRQQQQQQLPHGPQLLQTPILWMEFLEACRDARSSPRAFSELCQRWRKHNRGEENETMVADDDDDEDDARSELERLSNFQDFFAPGLIPAAKQNHNSHRHTPHTRRRPDDNLIPLLLQHGANVFETDHTQGAATPLHWAAGNGNLLGVHALLEAMVTERQTGSPIPEPGKVMDEENYYYNGNVVVDLLDEIREHRHGATPFHWACGSVRSNWSSLGDTTAGSYEVCRYLLQRSGERCTELANMGATVGYGKDQTRTTPLMWAAWAGNVPLVELLVVHGADPWAKDSKTNQTAFHWAAGGGHLPVCQYLLPVMCDHADKRRSSASGSSSLMGKDEVLLMTDATGRSSLDYARMYDRQEMVDWILEQSLASPQQIDKDQHPQQQEPLVSSQYQFSPNSDPSTKQERTNLVSKKRTA